MPIEWNVEKDKPGMKEQLIGVAVLLGILGFLLWLVMRATRKRK